MGLPLYRKTELEKFAFIGMYIHIAHTALNAVKVAKDLGYADIYFTVMGAKGETDAEIRANTSKILNEAAGYLRSQLARILTTRVTPQLRFHYDETLERGHHLTGLIKQARAADDARHPGDAANDGDDRQD